MTTIIMRKMPLSILLPSFRRLKTFLPSDECQILGLPVYKRFTFSHKNNTYHLILYSFFTYRMPRQK